jgi:6-phosphogluconolactonase
LETRSTLPPEFKGENTCAEVQLHPSGSFVYGSNRGHNSIAIFRVNPKDGRVQRIENVACGGKTPRHFALDPSGKWLLVENQDSNNVIVFAVDANTGHMTPTGEKIEVGAPVCLVFAP